MNTINNAIPFVPENTTDPAAGLNLSLNQIDALLQVLVQTVGANTPPTGVEGQRFIVGTAPTGAWAGQANKLARYLDGAWQFFDARHALNAADGLWYVRQASTWVSLAGSAPAWGSITGTLFAQTDLQSALDGKVGNSDARLTDAREWTATEVSQAEAEAGTATAARKWTALRVRQAAVAWWNSISSAWGRGLVASADAAAGRSALGLGTFAIASYATAPFINVMPDSGRFAGKGNPLGLAASATFTASPFFGAINGSTQSESGKFIHDNTTYGGTRGLLTEPVESLMVAMGRDPARYGVEFYVCRIKAGEGTTVPTTGTDGIVRYLLTVNNSRSLAASGGTGTAALWVRVVSGSMHISNTYWLNGVATPAGTPIPAGWHHVRVVLSTLWGYSNSHPHMFASQGADVDIALPAFFTGTVDTGLHKSPLPTINELSA